MVFLGISGDLWRSHKVLEDFLGILEGPMSLNGIEGSFKERFSGC